MTTALTTTEHQKYLECNAVIEHGLQTFFDVGNALMVVRNDRLYREEYGTFEDYCQEKWGWTRQHANRLISSAEVVGNLEPMGSILPTTERQTRELARVAPEKQRAVWKDVVETAPKGKVTAKHVQAVVKQHKEPARESDPVEPPKEPEPAPQPDPPKPVVGTPTKLPTFEQVWASLSPYTQKVLDSYPGSKNAVRKFHEATIALVAPH